MTAPADKGRQLGGGAPDVREFWARIEAAEVAPPSVSMVTPQPAPKVAPAEIERKILAGMAKPRPRLRGLDARSAAKMAGPPPFALVPVADLLREPRPHEWVLRGYIEGDSLVLLFRDPAVGKSLLALDWSACVATGTAWEGCRVKHGPVIYLAGEGHHGISRRMRAWETANDISLDGAPFFISIRRAGMPSEVDAIIAAADAAVAEHGAPVLLVVDTLARHIEGDENAPVDMGRFIAACDGLRERYRCAVLVVHHSGHADKSRARAHSSLPGALDASYLPTKDAGGIRELACVKAKDFEPPAPRHFRIRAIELPPPWVDEDGEPLDAPFLEATAPAANKRHKTPSGANQKLVWSALAEIFKKAGDIRPDDAPPNLPVGRPCIEILAAVVAVKDALTCEPARKAQRAREAIAGLIAGGLLASSAGFIWCA